MATIKGKPANRTAYLTIEKIENGFVLIEPTGRKTWKASLNGVVRYMEEAFDVRQIEVQNSPMTQTTIESIISKDTAIPKEASDN